MASMILLHGDLDNYVGTFHPLLVHFPIVLFTLTLICDLLYGIGKTKAFMIANWMLLGGIVMCIPTLATGWIASESFPVDDPILPIVQKHMYFAFTTSSLALIYGLFRLVSILKHWNIYPIVFVGLSVVLVTLVSWTSDYGGLISHGVTPFSEIKK